MITSRQYEQTANSMARLKSQSLKYVELKEEDYKQLLENSLQLEALKIAGIEKMPIYKAMQHILQHEHIDLLIKPVSRRYSWPNDFP